MAIALTNHLAPTLADGSANPTYEAVNSVAEWGLNISVDSIYSLVSFALQFVKDNLVWFIFIIAILAVWWFLLNKIRRRKAWI